jgi:ring-1,2-phenylacetyl-CoA epoxidase subunit PaaD
MAGETCEHIDGLTVSPAGGFELSQIWAWLDQVLDPEVPALSVVDLGVIRQVEWRCGRLLVQVTPTYSGCPATRAIEQALVAHLQTKGVVDVCIERVLAPAWSSDWITARGRERLLEYGIVPPVHAGPGRFPWSRAKPAIGCPQCAAPSPELVSEFGSTACKAQYRCRACKEPFEYFKCI